MTRRGRGRCRIVGAPLHDAFRDLIDGLTALGWQIELSLFDPAPPNPSGVWSRVDALVPAGRAQGALRRLRREVVDAPRASAWFARVEGELATLAAGEAALVFVDQAPIGLARLAARVQPRAVLVTLEAVTREWRLRRPMRLARWMATSQQGSLHVDLLQPPGAGSLRTVVCPSVSWEADLNATPVRPASSMVIPFGVPVPDDVPTRPMDVSSPARLIWAGRLSPEKGLHLFLEALPAIRAQRPIRLTAVAAPGPAVYARRIWDTIATLHLQDVVDLVPAVPRDTLVGMFSEADLLLFHSIFREPVAQVMLHAGAAGLPVVGPRTSDPRAALRDGATAWCYADTSPAAVADAVLCALANPDARVRAARALYDEVRTHHNLTTTIAAYDALLLDSTRGSRPEPPTA